jgi:hypothetical protein
MLACGCALALLVLRPSQAVAADPATAPTAVRTPESASPAPATAAAPATPEATASDSGDEVALAREHFNRGLAHFEAEQYQQAYDAFLEAYRLKPHPAVRINVAQSALLAERFVEAANLFTQYLLETAEGPDQSPAGETGLDEARQHALALDISVDVPDALINVDRVAVGRSPLQGLYFVEPGNHVVSAKGAKRRVRAKVSGQAGELQTVTLTLSDPPADEAARLPLTPIFDTRVEAERAPQSAGFLPWFVEHPWAWVGAGVAVAGLGGSLIFAVASGDRYDDAAATRQAILGALTEDRALIPAGASACGPPALDQQPQFTGQRGYAAACNRFNQESADADQLKTLSVVSLITGLVAAGGVTAYYLIDTMGTTETGAAPSPKLAIAPSVVGPLGVSLQGSF